MEIPSKRTHVLSRQQVEHLLAIRSLSIEALARKSKIHLRTLTRKLAGEPAYRSTIRRIAEALDVKPTVIINGHHAVDTGELSTGDMAFGLGLQLYGQVRTPEQMVLIANLSSEILARCAAAGIPVTNCKSTLAVVDRDEVRRTIVLVFGLLKNGRPFWTYVAVKSGKYELFLEAQRGHKLDLYQFDSFGEIIVSGEGDAPPEEITSQVAQLYQCGYRFKDGDTNVESEVDTKTRRIGSE
jgi:lambda repressor-like predicted transcriptional regulator